MTISNMSDLLHRLTGGSSGTPETVMVFKGHRISGTTWTIGRTGDTYTGWLLDGNAGTAPTTVAVPTNATAGAFPFTDAGGARTKKLVAAQLLGGGENYGNYHVYDRLLHIGSLSGTVTTAQTVGGTITRNTGGDGNFIAVEIYTQIGTTATTLTASYTNQAGTSGRTTVAVTFGGTGNRDVNRAIVLPLQSGDTGVQSVQSVTLAGSTGTAGNFGVVLGKSVFDLVATAGNTPPTKSFIRTKPYLPVIENGACLNYFFSVSSTSVSSEDWRDLLALMLYVES